jgi:hypothetical protein
VQIHFVSFRPGIFTTPPLDLGGILLRGIEMETRSVLEDRGEEDLRPPRRQLVIPGTWLKAGFLAAFLILFPPLLIFLWRKAPGWLARYRELRNRNLPLQRLRAVLRRLAKELSDMDGGRFFSELTAAIRIYLTEKLSFPAVKATTREIDRMLPGRMPVEPLPRDAASGIVALLQRGDHVKFGKRPCNRREMKSALRKTQELVEIVEEVENRVES